MTKWLRFRHLKNDGIVDNWTTLNRWIAEEGFPAGKLLGPNTRAFPEDEVLEWLRSTPDAGRISDGQRSDRQHIEAEAGTA